MRADLTCITSLDGCLSGWHAGAHSNLGYHETELLASPFLDLVHREDRPNAATEIERLRQGAARSSFQARCRRKDGSYRWFLWHATTDPEQSLIRASAQDITEAKVFESSLRRTLSELESHRRKLVNARKSESELRANVSHELRTPLNGIIGFAELLHGGRMGPVADAQREMLGDILTGAKYLLRLVEDIMDLSKVEAGEHRHQPEHIDLGNLVREVVSILAPLASDKQIAVEVEISDDVQHLFVDPGKLKQVLYNYLSNALKFTPNAGSVRVIAGAEGSWDFRIEVQDSGIGIDPEDLRLLFQKFPQLRKAPSSDRGLGLGLALTRRIVEAQSGRVGVASSQGKGSRFFAILPRNTSHHGTRTDSRLPRREGPAEVLVVSAHRPTAEYLSQAMAGVGFDLEVVSSGEQAHAALMSHQYRAVAIDVHLADFSAWELISAIRSAGPNRKTPASLVAAIPELGLAGLFKIDDVLWKPLDTIRLVSSVAGAGVSSGKTSRVLVFDTNAATRESIETALQANGYATLGCATQVDALHTVRTEKPDAIIVNLTSPHVDSFAFAQQIHEIASQAPVPWIGCIERDLDIENQIQLGQLAQKALLQHSGNFDLALSGWLDRIQKPLEEFPAQRAG